MNFRMKHLIHLVYLPVEIKNTPDEVINACKLLVKVNCPSNNEINSLKDNEVLFPSNLHWKGLNDSFFICGLKFSKTPSFVNNVSLVLKSSL